MCVYRRDPQAFWRGGKSFQSRTVLGWRGAGGERGIICSQLQSRPVSWFPASPDPQHLLILRHVCWVCQSSESCLSRLATATLLRDHLDGAMARLQTLVLTHTSVESTTSPVPGATSPSKSLAVAPRLHSSASASEASAGGASSLGSHGTAVTPSTTAALSRLPSFLSLMDR